MMAKMKQIVMNNEKSNNIMTIKHYLYKVSKLKT